MYHPRKSDSLTSYHYISPRPEVIAYQPLKNDEYIIMTSDGISDELNIDDISKIVTRENGNFENLPDVILNEAIDHSLRIRNMSLEKYSSLPQRSVRNIHDDMTVMVIKI